MKRWDLVLEQRDTLVRVVSYSTSYDMDEAPPLVVRSPMAFTPDPSTELNRSLDWLSASVCDSSRS